MDYRHILRPPTSFRFDIATINCKLKVSQICNKNQYLILKIILELRTKKCMLRLETTISRKISLKKVLHMKFPWPSPQDLPWPSTTANQPAKPTQQVVRKTIPQNILGTGPTQQLIQTQTFLHKPKTTIICILPEGTHRREPPPKLSFFFPSRVAFSGGPEFNLSTLRSHTHSDSALWIPPKSKLHYRERAEYILIIIIILMNVETPACNIFPGSEMQPGE